MLGAIGGSPCAVGTGIMIIMVVSVSERYQEIRLRKPLGPAVAMCFFQFLSSA